MAKQLRKTKTSSAAGVAKKTLANKKQVARRRTTAADRIESLKSRCEACDFDFEASEWTDEETLYRVSMPAGRQKRIVALFSDDQVRDFLAIDFENYVFLGDYAAVCCYNTHIIEAAIRPIRLPSSFVIRRLLGEPINSETQDRATGMLLNVSSGTNDNIASIRLAYASSTLKALSRGPGRLQTLSIRIEGVPFHHHDEALSILERLANSFFFQIDMIHNIALTLRRDPTRERQPGASAQEQLDTELTFPLTEYDTAPITLYWYARSATGMPLLQFLGYYQSIEFYFPTYYRAEATRRVRNVLKNPSFRADRDADIGRVLSSLSVSPSGRPDERTMLRATIRECVDPADLRNFIEASDDRQKFLASRAEGLTNEKVPVANADADLRDSVADRIYDIRCKIVHTKIGASEGDNVELLLPFSKQERNLAYDLGLIRYIAQRVLIAGSAPVSL